MLLIQRKEMWSTRLVLEGQTCIVNDLSNELTDGVQDNFRKHFVMRVTKSQENVTSVNESN